MKAKSKKDPFREMIKRVLFTNDIVYRSSGFLNADNQNQIGGTRKSKTGKEHGLQRTKFSHEGIDLFITKEYIDESVTLSFATLANLERSQPQKCAFILFSHNSEEAPIIGEEDVGDSSAYIQSFENMNKNGVKIMHGVIEYLKNYSEYRLRIGKLALKYIQLKDNSYIYIDRVRIELADYYTLTRGGTYYSQFGFIPFNEVFGMADSAMTLNLVENQSRMKYMKVSQHPWFLKMFPDCAKKKDHLLGESIRRLFKTRPREIVPRLGELYSRLGLVSVVRRSWYLPLY